MADVPWYVEQLFASANANFTNPGENMRNMQGFKITADKDKLLKTLTANRAQHMEIFLEAVGGYRKDVIAKLKLRIGSLKGAVCAGAPQPEKFLHFPDAEAPRCFVGVYDHVISMLTMHTGAEVELDSDQHMNWVEDKWDWSSSFTTSNSPYSSKL